MTQTADLQSTLAAANASTDRSDKGRAFAALHGKQARQKALWGYYDGDQPLLYSTKRLREIFKSFDVHFNENWCAVVVDSLKDKVNLTGFKCEKDAAAQTALDAWWDGSELNLGSDDTHEAALVIGEGYQIIWPETDAAGGAPPQANFNDPLLCHVQYSAENPRLPVWASKWWVGDDARLYLNLYYPDRLEYYVSTKKAADVYNAAGLVEAAPTAANPYEEIPVFHFRSQRRAIKGELENVVPLQNAINKLLADMMVTAEFGAAPQRYAVGVDSDTKLENGPDKVWVLPEGSSAGQFVPTDLGAYLNGIDKLVSAIGTITRTPAHYFVGEAGANLSGEALIAMEAPLNHKAQDRIDAFTPTWQRAAAFALKIMGITVAPSDILPVFDKPETIQPMTQAQITLTRTQSGMPLASALHLEGMDQAEIDEVEKERKAEAAANAPAAPLGLAARVLPVQSGEPAAPTGGQ